jgi:predicted metal-dependent hydrolase
VSVVSDKVIFCEGKQTSLDFRLLNKVVENLSTNKPTIVPSGSKFTFSAFVEGYFSSSGKTQQKYIIFRDRDFDAQPTANIELIQLYSMFLTHRACVENYLFNADLIHNYWVTKYTEKQNNPISTWGHGDSPGIEAISAWIEEAARSLQDYQVVRWALADLLRSSTTRHQLKTTWTGGSGKLPRSLTLHDCQQQALLLINQFQQAVETVTQEIFTESIARYQQKFSQEEFWTSKQYLIWFHGKDIQKAMQQQQSQYISLKSFFDWVLNELDVNQYPDLIELQNRISSM